MNLAILFLILGCIAGGIALLFLILEFVYSQHPKNKKLFIILFSLSLLVTIVFFILFAVYKYILLNLKKESLLLAYPNYNSTTLAPISLQKCTTPYICPNLIHNPIEYIPSAKSFTDKLVETLTYIKNNNYQALQYDSITNKYYCYKISYINENSKYKAIITNSLDNNQMWIDKDILGISQLQPPVIPP